MLSNIYNSFFSENDEKKAKGLCLQFLIREIVCIYETLEKCKEHSSKDLEKLLHSLNPLLSSSTDSLSPERIGHIDKILFYMKRFWSQKPALYYPFLILKKKIVTQKNLLVAFSKKQIQLNNCFFQEQVVFIAGYAKLLLKQLIESLQDAFHNFKENENVLFCLFKYKKPLMLIHNLSFFQNISEDHIEKLICKYKQRGFTSFILENKNIIYPKNRSQ